MAWTIERTPPLDGTARGIIAILTAVFLLSFSDVLVKLSGDRFGLAQLVLLRSIVAAILLATWVIANKNSSALRLTRPGWVWPERYSGRVLRTTFVDCWNDDDAGLRRDLPSQERLWQTAIETADISVVAPFVGEAIGLVGAGDDAAGVIALIQADMQEVFGHLSGLISPA